MFLAIKVSLLTFRNRCQMHTLKLTYDQKCYKNDVAHHTHFVNNLARTRSEYYWFENKCMTHMVSQTRDVEVIWHHSSSICNVITLMIFCTSFTIVSFWPLYYGRNKYIIMVLQCAVRNAHWRIECPKSNSAHRQKFRVKQTKLYWNK